MPNQQTNTRGVPTPHNAQWLDRSYHGLTTDVFLKLKCVPSLSSRVYFTSDHTENISLEDISALKPVDPIMAPFQFPQNCNI